jgi:hypothetical protein
MVRQNCCIRTVPDTHPLDRLKTGRHVTKSLHRYHPKYVCVSPITSAPPKPYYRVSQTLPLSDSVSTLLITDRTSGSPTVGVFTTFLVLVRLVAHTYFIRQGCQKIISISSITVVTRPVTNRRQVFSSRVAVTCDRRVGRNGTVSSSVLQNHLNFLTAAHESDPLQLDGDVKSGIRHVFYEGVRGYTGMFTESVVDKIREMPEVDYVEKDQIVRITPVDT